MNLRSRIKKTISYSAFFGSKLDLTELHYWLIINTPITKQQLKKYYSGESTQNKNLTERKIASIKPALKFLKSIPTIKLIALTGSLAINNGREGDDVDLMIITTPHTLWLTRLLVVPIMRLLFKTRTPTYTPKDSNNAVCLNLWLDALALSIPQKKQNLYVAHEVLQIRPLFNQDQTYERFILTNGWTAKYLANAYQQITARFVPVPISSSLSLPSYPLSPLNFLAFKLQYLYMKSKITREYVTLHSAYFHPKDLSTRLKKRVSLRTTN